MLNTAYNSAYFSSIYVSVNQKIMYSLVHAHLGVIFSSTSITQLQLQNPKASGQEFGVLVVVQCGNPPTVTWHQPHVLNYLRLFLFAICWKIFQSKSGPKKKIRAFRYQELLLGAVRIGLPLLDSSV